jgi:hypothetical protein
MLPAAMRWNKPANPDRQAQVSMPCGDADRAYLANLFPTRDLATKRPLHRVSDVRLTSQERTFSQRGF